MSSSVLAVIIGSTLTLIGGLIAIIYTNLNKKTCDNALKIEKASEKHVTKEEFNGYKQDQARESDRVREDYKGLDKKLDKIISMLMEGRQNES